jgi:hypothetical protein
VVDANLHVVVAHAVDQQSLQVEQVLGGCQLQQSRELDAGVALRHLPDQPHQSHVLQRVRVLRQRGVCASKQFIIIISQLQSTAGQASPISRRLARSSATRIQV